MTTPRVILFGLVLAFALSLVMALRAHAAIVSVPSHEACAPEDEMARTLDAMGVVQIMGGTAGAKDDNLGEVWVNPDTKLWFFIQRIPAAGMACVVLGGEQMTGKGAGI